MAFKRDANQPGFFSKKDLLIRHFFVLVLAILFSLMGKGSSFGIWVLSNFILIGSIWNGNLLLVQLLDRDLQWDKHIRLKIALSSSIALIWPVMANYLFNIFIFPIIHGHPCELQSKENITYLIVSVSITLFINSVYAANAFFRFWQTTFKEKEALKRESISAEFATLKNQINPHFLFNSLNTLTSLIEENPQTATQFVQKMSSVYRYVLTQRDKETVSLREELPFIESYVYLNKIRFGNNLRVHIHIEDSQLDKHVVTLALQMLIENAIKHNVISEQRPLHIDLGVHQNRVFVRNNLQRKAVMNDSNGVGLNNIAHRYSILAHEQVEITDDGKEFMVSLPLL